MQAANDSRDRAARGAFSPADFQGRRHPPESTSGIGPWVLLSCLGAVASRLDLSTTEAGSTRHPTSAARGSLLRFQRVEQAARTSRFPRRRRLPARRAGRWARGPVVPVEARLSSFSGSRARVRVVQLVVARQVVRGELRSGEGDGPEHHHGPLYKLRTNRHRPNKPTCQKARSPWTARTLARHEKGATPATQDAR